jgi:hypothetical protein
MNSLSSMEYIMYVASWKVLPLTERNIHIAGCKWNKQRGGKSKGYITVSWFAESWARETTSIYGALSERNRAATGETNRWQAI